MQLIPIEKWTSTGNSKASQIKELHNLKFDIPRSYILEVDTTTAIDIQIERLDISVLLEGIHYVVRSSVSKEDQMITSMAGMYLSLVNIELSNLKDAIKKVYQSYGNTVTLERHELILIQEMIVPDYSGILFTKNPLNQSNEILIEYCEGNGSEKIQQGANPMRLYYKAGKFIAKDKNVPPSIFEMLCKKSKVLERHFSVALDIEWAIVGSRIYWLQARPITSNSSMTMYDNTISKNYLPGMIKPLVYDINIPLINGAWIKILSEIIGPINIKPESLAKAFYYRTYFNMGVLGSIFKQIGFRADFLEKLQGITQPELEVPFRPTRTLFKNSFRGVMFYLRAQRTYHDITGMLEKYHEKSILIERKIEAATSFKDLENCFSALRDHLAIGAYYKILIPLMNIAKQRKYVNQIKQLEIDMGESFFSEQNSLYNPSTFISRHKSDWNEDINSQFLNRFGHFSDNNNDFSIHTWMEKPEMVASLFSSGKCSKPVMKDVSRRLIRKKRKADQGNFKVNQLTYYYNYAYSLFRKLFLEWGNTLLQNGLIDAIDDVFYLNYLTLIDLSYRKLSAESLRKKVKSIKHEFESLTDIQLPAKIYGEEDPIPITEHAKSTRYIGVPVSKGRVRGKIRKITSVSDISKIDVTDIVVIPHSDMSFEPVLNKAKALLIESGGMLSHMGILAREMSVPAITSIESIMGIADRTLVSIDCYIGEVIVLEEST